MKTGRTCSLKGAVKPLGTAMFGIRVLAGTRELLSLINRSFQNLNKTEQCGFTVDVGVTSIYRIFFLKLLLGVFRLFFDMLLVLSMFIALKHNHFAIFYTKVILYFCVCVVWCVCVGETLKGVGMGESRFVSWVFRIKYPVVYKAFQDVAMFASSQRFC